MSKNFRLAAILAITITMVSAAIAVFAQGVSSQASGSGQPAGGAVEVVSSSTNMQSFLWIIDDRNNTITFCFTTASPETGPQYDFGCRQRPTKDAVMH